MDEGKVIIEAKDSGGVRIALRPAEDGSIWMNIRGDRRYIQCWRSIC